MTNSLLPRFRFIPSIGNVSPLGRTSSCLNAILSMDASIFPSTVRSPITALPCSGSLIHFPSIFNAPTDSPRNVPTISKKPPFIAASALCRRASDTNVSVPIPALNARYGRMSTALGDTARMFVSIPLSCICRCSIPRATDFVTSVRSRSVKERK